MNTFQMFKISLCSLIMLSPLQVAAKKDGKKHHRQVNVDIEPYKRTAVEALNKARKTLKNLAEGQDAEVARLLNDLAKFTKEVSKNPAAMTKEKLTHAFTLIEQATNKLDPIPDASDSCDYVIDTVPATIDKPGTWCTNKDHTYTGTGAAITVTADNATVNFNNHSLALTNTAAVGISATDVSKLVIQNNKIHCTTVSDDAHSAAIFLSGVTKVTLENVHTLNTYYSVQALKSDGMKIVNCNLEAHECFLDSQHIVIEN